jgi:hypothetical protein
MTLYTFSKKSLSGAKSNLKRRKIQAKCESFAYLSRSFILNSSLTLNSEKAYTLSSLLSCETSRASIVESWDKAFRTMFNLLGICRICIENSRRDFLNSALSMVQLVGKARIVSGGRRLLDKTNKIDNTNASRQGWLAVICLIALRLFMLISLDEA